MQHGFTFCICPDSMLLQEYLSELYSKHKQEHNWIKHTYWGDEELDPTFWNKLLLQNIFEKKIILIIRNAHNISTDIWKKLSSVLSKPNPNTWPIFCLECSWEKKQPKVPNALQKLPCFLFAKKQGWIWSSPGLETSTIKKYIEKQTKQLNITFTPEALNKLIQVLPPQAATINNELKKIALYTNGEVATIQHIKIINVLSNFDIFTVIRYIQTNNISELWKTILSEQNKNEDPLFYILAVMQKEAKKLWQLYTNDCIISNTHDTIKKQLAMKIGITKIVKLWSAIHSAEYSVKSGIKTPAQSLELFITELSSIFC